MRLKEERNIQSETGTSQRNGWKKKELTEVQGV